jgi:hypothetical protein
MFGILIPGLTYNQEALCVRCIGPPLRLDACRLPEELGEQLVEGDILGNLLSSPRLAYRIVVQL